MKLKPVFPVFLLIFQILVGVNLSKAQQGQYISLGGGVQQARLENRIDITQNRRGSFNNSYSSKPAYNLNLHLTYANNFSNNFGFETGLHYSDDGQRYNGQYTPDQETFNFDSELRLTYLKFPLLFVMNSTMDESSDRVFFTMKAGLQINYLLSADFELNENIRSNETATINTMELYRQLGTSVRGEALFNFMISDRVFAYTGVSADYSIGSIENTDYNYPDNAPSWYYFPVSVPQDKIPNLEIRGSSKNNILALLIGLRYRFKFNN